MIREFHGKVYYVQCKSVKEAEWFIDLLYTFDDFDDEILAIRREVDGTAIVYTLSLVTLFRGQKYSVWEKCKSKLYRNRKKEP